MIHAVWNLMLAGARNVEATTAIALTTSGVIFAPIALWRWDVDADAVPFLAASSTLHLTYFALLAAAYARADLSVVYPLARGVAPVFVLAGSVAVTDASTSAEQVVGVLLVTAGVLFVRGLRRGHRLVFGLAIAAGVSNLLGIILFDVQPRDPVIFGSVVVVLTATAMLACVVPVRRATRVDPMVALRVE